MQIQFPTAPTTVAPTRALTAVTWSINQLLVAEVVGAPQQNFSRLTIGDLTVTARSEVPLTAGQKLAVQVVATAPTIVLKVVGAPAAAVASALDRALARQLPRQATPQDATRMVRALHTLASDAAAPGPARATRLALALTSTAQNLPRPADLMRADSLRSLLLNVATPLEARLGAALASGSPPTLAADLRGQLLQLQAELTSSPPGTAARADGNADAAALAARAPTAAPRAAAALDAAPVTTSARESLQTSPAHLGAESDVNLDTAQFKQLLDGVLSRLQVNQLQHVAQPNAPVPPLVIEIPLFHQGQGEFLRFEFEDEDGARQQETEASRRSHVRISLIFDDGQDFAARLRLAGESLHVRLGSSDDDYTASLGAHIADLRRQLEQQGIATSQLVVAALAADTEAIPIARQLVKDQV